MSAGRMVAPALTGQIGRQFHEARTLTRVAVDRKSTRLNSSHSQISYAVFCLKKKRLRENPRPTRGKPCSRSKTATPPSSAASSGRETAKGAEELRRTDTCQRPAPPSGREAPG